MAIPCSASCLPSVTHSCWHFFRKQGTERHRMQVCVLECIRYYAAFFVGDGLLVSHAIVQEKWSGDRAVSQLLLRLLQPKLVRTSGQTGGRGCWMDRRMRGDWRWRCVNMKEQKASVGIWRVIRLKFKARTNWTTQKHIKILTVCYIFVLFCAVLYPLGFEHCRLHACWTTVYGALLGGILDQCHCSAFRFASPRHCWADQWCLQFEKTWPGLSYACL